MSTLPHHPKPQFLNRCGARWTQEAGSSVQVWLYVKSAMGYLLIDRMTPINPDTLEKLLRSCEELVLFKEFRVLGYKDIRVSLAIHLSGEALLMQAIK